MLQIFLKYICVGILLLQIGGVFAVDPIQISDGSLTLKEGESQTLVIMSGGGGYQKQSGDESIANIRISSSSNTGTLKVSGVHYGQEEYVIRDQYFQTKSFGVTVEDTILDLSHEVLELMSSNSEYISARESYQGIKSFTKSNENIRVIKKLLEDGQEVLEVFPERAGETILTVYDNQDNVDSVRVIVGGNTQTGGGTGSGSTGSGATGSGEILSFQNLIYEKAETTEGLAAIYFDIVGGIPQEVGVQYKDDTGIHVKELLDIQTDGTYVVGIDKDECLSCYEAFTPYIITQSGNLILYNTNTYLAFETPGNISIAEVQESIEINSVSSTTKKFFRDMKKTIGTAIENRQGYFDGTSQATLDAFEDLKDTPKDIYNLVKNTGKIIVAYAKGERTPSQDALYAKQQLGVLYDTIEIAHNEFKNYKEYLTAYNIQYVESYVGTSYSLMAAGPGKLKVVKSTDRVVEKIENITYTGKKVKALSLLKPIKSIDSHIFTKHIYGANLGGSEFLQGADIDAIIREGYGKTGKRAIETMSGNIPSIKVEVDMGRIIGNANNSTSKLRIIVDYEGNIISSYPIDSFQIQ